MYSSFHLPIIENTSTYVVNMHLGENFAFGILQYSQIAKMNRIFRGLDVVMSILNFVQSHSTITHVRTCVKLLTLTEMGLSTLSFIASSSQMTSSTLIRGLQTNSNVFETNSGVISNEKKTLRTAPISKPLWVVPWMNERGGTLVNDYFPLSLITPRAY